MKFLVDAQLPIALSSFLKAQGQDSVHTLELPEKNKTEDGFITRLAIAEQRIVITKDSDFLESYILKREPPKLLLIKTGNIRNSQLIAIFSQQLKLIVELFQTHSLIEVTATEIVVHT